MPLETSVEKSSKLIRQWLQECNDRHPACKLNTSESLLPTRVIDVGNSADEVRLHCSKGEISGYAALSHCWGETKPMTTTKATLDAHQKALKVESRDKTFVDAINVTRSLGLRYLW